MAKLFQAGDIGFTVVKPENGKVFSGKELTAYMDGGFFQAVPMPDGTVLWCDEDGISKGLPLNAMATMLYGEFVYGETLLGPVLITSQEEVRDPEEEEFTDR